MQRSRLLLIESSSLKKCQQSEAYQTSYGKEINPYGNQVLYCLVQIIALFVNLRGIEPLDSAIPNSNSNIRYGRYLAFMQLKEISLISDVFRTSSSNLSLLESQQPANKLDQSLNRALR